MGLRVLLDWSTICYQQWFRMKSPDYQAVTGIELAEFSRNMALTMATYEELFKGAEFFFALDSNSWRYSFYENYYKKHTKILESESEADVYVIIHDSLHYLISKNESGEFYRKKLKKSEIEELAFNDEEFWKVHTEVPEQIANFLPKYKGHRMDSDWPFATPKPIWKENCRALAYNLANTMKAKVLEAKGAEADDIAYAWVNKYSSDDLILVTTDSDWHQLFNRAMFVRVFNPKNLNFEVLETSKVKKSLWVKVIGGDKSDDIHGLVLNGKSSKFAEDGALKKVEEVGLNKISDYLKANVPKPSLFRNMKLIVLGNLPEEVSEAIEKTLKFPKRAKQYYTYFDYGVDSKELMIAKGQAKDMRKSFSENA